MQHKITPKTVLLYSQVSVLPQTGIKGEWETLECADPNEMSPSILFAQVSESFAEEEAEGV